MFKHLTLVILFFVGLLLAGCTPKTGFDPRGEWEYVMTAADGNTYDSGTMTFSGEAAKGTYLQRNFYQVEYKGEFAVSGANLKLAGYETWEGALVDANTLKGSWKHDDGVNGTFTAKRK